MKSALQLKRRIFPYGHVSEYTLKERLPADGIGKLTDLVLHMLIPDQVYHGAPLRDQKGRDPNLLLERDLPAHLKPNDHELLFIAGKVLSQKEEGSDDTDQEEGPDEFTVSITTPFDRSLGAHHMSHNVKVERLGALPDDLPLKKIIRALPVEIAYLRFGIELYQSKLVSSLFGFSPIVTQRLLIECHGTDLQLKIIAEGLKKKNTLPLKENGLIDKLSKVLQELCNFDLIADYQAAIVS